MKTFTGYHTSPAFSTLQTVTNNNVKIFCMLGKKLKLPDIVLGKFLAALGEAEAAYEGLLAIAPITPRNACRSAALRQSNAYFSSSDADFPDRYAGSCGPDCSPSLGSAAAEGNDSNSSALTCQTSWQLRSETTI